MIGLFDTPLDPVVAFRDFETRNAGAGATVYFTGSVRGDSRNGPVTGLHLQAYPGVTEAAIEATAVTAKKRWDLSDVMILHRTGDMASGDPIVFVATAAPHRRAAFEACDFLMDYLKTEAIFWKKEITANGTDWIEPRAEDYEDAARWRNKEEIV